MVFEPLGVFLHINVRERDRWTDKLFLTSNTDLTAKGDGILWVP